MAVSTKSLAATLDVIAAKGIPDPRSLPQGYSDTLPFELASQVMADLITERFNWKFNRGVATPFYTNSWQQDYPQLAQPAGIIAWGEDCDICDINNSTVPKPLNWDGPVTWKQQLSRTSLSNVRPRQITWMYNEDLAWGTWPGPGTVYYPLVSPTGSQSQNPLMNFIDIHGNYLILTAFGTTGSVAPSAPANSAEGVIVTDGSCQWTVVSGKSQGFRLDVMTAGNSVVYQILPTYQLEPPQFATFDQLLTPIPDSFSRHFQRGLEAQCLIASPNPGDRERGSGAYGIWLKSLEDIRKQANKNPGVYQLIPASSPVEERWGWYGPRTADQPI